MVFSSNSCIHWPSPHEEFVILLSCAFNPPLGLSERSPLRHPYNIMDYATGEKCIIDIPALTVNMIENFDNDTLFSELDATLCWISHPATKVVVIWTLRIMVDLMEAPIQYQSWLRKKCSFLVVGPWAAIWIPHMSNNIANFLCMPRFMTIWPSMLMVSSASLLRLQSKQMAMYCDHRSGVKYFSFMSIE